MRHILFKPCLALAALNWFSCITPATTPHQTSPHHTNWKQDSEGLTPILHQAHREDRKKWSPPHLTPVWEKQAHTSSVYDTHHLLVLLAFHSAVPMTLVHLALNLYSENKAKQKETPTQIS